MNEGWRKRSVRKLGKVRRKKGKEEKRGKKGRR